MPTHHDYDADGTVRDEMLAAQEDEQFRETLGRMVRVEWIAWAQEQSNPKPSWLKPWELLDEADKEVDCRIGERLFRAGLSSAVDSARKLLPKTTVAGLHSPDMTGRCFKCGEQVGSDLRGCEAPPYKSPREVELERENATLLDANVRVNDLLDMAMKRETKLQTELTSAHAQLETARNTIHRGGAGAW